jgi:hypothetical protein
MEDTRSFDRLAARRPGWLFDEAWRAALPFRWTYMTHRAALLLTTCLYADVSPLGVRIR